MNPFGKVRPQHRRLRDRDVENGLDRTRSENDNVQRRLGGDGPLVGARHAATMPVSQGSGSSSHAPKTLEGGQDPVHENPLQPTHEDSNSPFGELKGSEAAHSSVLEQQPAEGDTGTGFRRRGLRFLHRGKKTETEKGAHNQDNERAANAKLHFTVWSQFRHTIFNSWINLLIFAAPVGIGLNFVNGIPPIAVFVVNFIAIVPLAAMLSYATEEIALRTGETIGGLLNATFGNAVELIVSIIALFHDEITIVQTSLIGSMLSNLLLVMGMCFFFGGLNRQQQHFNITVAQTASSLLALAIASLIIPTAFSKWANLPTSSDDNDVASDITKLSRGTSVLLLVVYGCYLYFQLSTHAEIYNEPSEKTPKREKGKSIGKALMKAHVNLPAPATNSSARDDASGSQENAEEEKEQPQLYLWVAVFTLAWATALIAVCAEFMVSSINGLTATSNVTTTFVGLILLPIVGNAAEHATAVTVACKDKMDLAIGVAVGSSMQIALLVLPLVVVIGWIGGKNDMTLNFSGFEVIVLFVAVLLVNYLITDGKSHWLEGVLLNILYLIIALSAWFYPNDATSVSASSP